MVVAPLILFSMFFKLLFWQAVVASFVIGGLVVLLNKTLINAAFSQLEYWKNLRPVRKIVVISHKALKKHLEERVRRVIAKKFGADVDLSFESDPKLWGGVIIRADDTVIDFNLKGRLRQALRW